MVREIGANSASATFAVMLVTYYDYNYKSRSKVWHHSNFKLQAPRKKLYYIIAVLYYVLCIYVVVISIFLVTFPLWVNKLCGNI